MWPRISLEDLRVILHYLGVLTCFLGITMLVPVVVALCLSEYEIAIHYFLGISIAFLFGTLLMLFKFHPTVLSRKQAICVTGLAWVVLGIFAAIPLYLSGHFSSTLDAYFEIISGLTTTGFSLVHDVDHLSYADNMWRFMMHFFGGQGVIVIALGLGIFGRTGYSLYTAEGRSEHILPDIKNTTRFIGKVALIVTTLGTVTLTVICLTQGLSPLNAFFNGLWITLGSYNTGGFAPHSTSTIYYQSWPFEVATLVVMLLGSTNFLLYGELWKGRTKELFCNIETRTLFWWLAVLVGVFSSSLFAGGYISDVGTVMRRGVYTIISAATSTGYQLFTNNQMHAVISSGAFFVVVLAMAIGSCSGSTAGGIKTIRLGIVVKSCLVDLKSVLLPETAQVSATYYHGGKHVLTREEANGAMVVFALFAASMVLGALLGIAYGYDALSAIFESVSATGDTGLSAGIVSSSMPLALELTYLLQMLLGRLEFLSLLAVIIALVMSPFPHLRTRRHTDYE